MSIRKILMAIFPEFLINQIRLIRYKKLSRKCFYYDERRYFKHSNAFYKWNSSDKLLGQVVAEYHVIEKGLTMPNMRLGFGLKVMNDLINHCKLYSVKFDKTNEHFLYALKVIGEYKCVHENSKFELDQNLLILINNLLEAYNCITPSRQVSTTRREYFQHVQGNFFDFSYSRHSLRDFSGSIDIETYKRAFQLAQNALSACNRQPSRLYLIQNREIIENVLKIQSGNRGFGHLADKLIILTAELGVFFGFNERNDAFVNGGIYAMNLLYALHYYQIGACTLNWCAMPEQDMELRKLCNIADSEVIIVIIACGGVPESFKLATSYRNDYSEILKII